MANLIKPQESTGLGLRLTRVCWIVLLVLAPIGRMHAQEIASTDLAQPSVTSVVPQQEQIKHEFATSCGKPGVGFADGVVSTDSHAPIKIEVDVVSIGDTRLVIGHSVEATIRLKNTGAKPIQIPWSTDFRTTQDGQDPKMRSWNVGWFEVSLKNKETVDNVELKSKSQNLFASKLVSGSSLTIKPGEWISVQIAFNVEMQHPQFERLEKGDSELSVEWFQTARTRRVADCGVTLGYFTYTYQQINPLVAVEVENEESDALKNTPH
jgi:hypothetical protein